jgi:hypothetical protein
MADREKMGVGSSTTAVVGRLLAGTLPRSSSAPPEPKEVRTRVRKTFGPTGVSGGDPRAGLDWRAPQTCCNGCRATAHSSPFNPSVNAKIPSRSLLLEGAELSQSVIDGLREAAPLTLSWRSRRHCTVSRGITCRSSSAVFPMFSRLRH